VSSDDGHGTAGEENGKLCIAVGPTTTIASVLTQLVKGTAPLAVKIEPAIHPGSYSSLIGFTFAGSEC